MIVYRVFDPDAEERRTYYFSTFKEAKEYAREVCEESDIDTSVVRCVTPRLTGELLLAALNDGGVFTEQKVIWTAWRVNRGN